MTLSRAGKRIALLVLGLVPMSQAHSAPAPCPSSAVQIAAGADIQAAVRAHGPGTSFCLAAGVYRLQSVLPKRGQRFYGRGNAILNGARLLTDFRQDGALWFAPRQSQQGFRHAGEHCIAERPRCDHPEAFFVDDQPLLAVASKADVAAGTFFFDYDANRIYFGIDPAGKNIEASVKPYAFQGGASGVVIDGLIVEKYSSPIQAAAIGGNTASDNWRVSNSEVRLNYGVGVTVGSHSVIRDSFIHDNGEMGIGCVGNGVLIAGNEIARNGWFAGLDPAWEGGGGKCALTDGLVFRDNHSHDNNSYGFWTDIDNINTLYEGNRIEHNANGGISHEISYKATIRNNIFKGNGYAFNVWLWGSAILVQNSRDVEVHGNRVEIAGAGNGISFIQQNRGSGAYGPHDTVDNFVHHNVVIARERDIGAWGAIADYRTAAMKAGRNRIDHNIYHLHDKAHDQWGWVDGFYTWAVYRQKSGQDRSSTIIIDPK
jgi:parallel beta-helix repeat protein